MNKQKPKIVISEEFKKYLESQTKEKETYEETILRLIGLKKE